MIVDKQNAPLTAEEAHDILTQGGLAPHQLGIYIPDGVTAWVREPRDDHVFVDTRGNPETVQEVSVRRGAEILRLVRSPTALQLRTIASIWHTLTDEGGVQYRGPCYGDIRSGKCDFCSFRLTGPKWTDPWGNHYLPD